MTQLRDQTVRLTEPVRLMEAGSEVEEASGVGAGSEVEGASEVEVGSECEAVGGKEVDGATVWWVLAVTDLCWRLSLS